MGKVLVFDHPRSIRFDDYEERNLQPDEVRLQTLYSGISAGTQLTAYRGTNPSATKQWNPVFQLFEHRDTSSSMYPVIGGWAYEEVGTVAEIGPNVTKVAIGDVIYSSIDLGDDNTDCEECREKYKKDTKKGRAAVALPVCVPRSSSYFISV